MISDSDILTFFLFLHRERLSFSEKEPRLLRDQDLEKLTRSDLTAYSEYLTYYVKNEENEEIEETIDETEAEDIPISQGFSVNPLNVSEDLDIFSNSDNKPKSLFDSFQTIDNDEDYNDNEEDEPKKKRGFFRRKK